MRVYSAHDGVIVHEVDQPLRAFGSVSALADVVSLVTGIVAEAVIIITDDGAQLTDELLAQLLEGSTVASQQQSFRTDPDLFVFSRDILSAEPEVVAPELQEPLILESALGTMQVARPPTPNSLQELLVYAEHAATTILIHAQRAHGLLNQMEIVRKGSQVALYNLIQHAESIQQASDALQSACRLELTRMRALLDAYEGALAALDFVTVRPELLPPVASPSNAIGSSSTDSSFPSPPPTRALSSWINKDRMCSVAAQGQVVYEKMLRQIEAIEDNGRQHHAAMLALQDEAGPASTQFASDSRDEAVQASGRTQELAQYMFDVGSPDQNGWPVADKLNDSELASLAVATDELILCDEVARDAIRRLTAELNTARTAAVYHLSEISHLQSVYADYGGEIALAQESLPIPPTFDGPIKVEYFRYLQRLVSILPAYGATVAERVRRAEFSQAFLDRSTAFAQLMVDFSMDDRRQRQRYDQDHRKHLPWEIRGLDKPPPSLHIKTERTESEPSSTRPTRQHVYELLELLDRIDQALGTTNSLGSSGAPASKGANKAVVIVPGTSSSDVMKPTSSHVQQSGVGNSWPSPTQDTRELLHNLLAEMDSVSERFERLVETHLLREGDTIELSSSASSDADEACGGRDPFDPHSKMANEPSLPARPRALRRALLDERKEHTTAIQALQDERDEASAAAARDRSELHRKAADVEELQAKARHLVADADTAHQRHLNLLDELTAQRRELEMLRRAERDAQQAAEDDAVRIAELEEALATAQAENQTQADLVSTAQAAQAAAEVKANRVPEESPLHRAELAAAQSEVAELRAEVASLRTQLARQQEATRNAEHDKEKMRRTARAEADADAALVARLQLDVDSATRDLGSARRAARAAAADADSLTEALAALRAQLAAADEDHVQLTRRVDSAERARQAADVAAATANERYMALLSPAAQWAHALLAVRAALLAMPAMASRASAHAAPGTASAATSPSQEGVKSANAGPVVEEAHQAQDDALEGFVSALLTAAPKMGLSATALAGPARDASLVVRPRSQSAAEPSGRAQSPVSHGHLSGAGSSPCSPKSRPVARQPLAAATLTAASDAGRTCPTSAGCWMGGSKTLPTTMLPGERKVPSSPSRGRRDERETSDPLSADRASAVTAPEPGLWNDRWGAAAMDHDLLELESALGHVYSVFAPSTISNEAKVKLENLVRVVKKWMKAYRSVKDNYDRVRTRGNGSHHTGTVSLRGSTSMASPPISHQPTHAPPAGALVHALPAHARPFFARPNGDHLAFTSFLPGDLALFLPTREHGSSSGTVTAPTWAAFNIAAPHHFLNTLPPEYSAGPKRSAARTASLVQGKQWLVARVTRVAVYVAGSAEPLVVVPTVDNSALPPSPSHVIDDAVSFMTNPFRLPLGCTYYVLDAIEFEYKFHSPAAALPATSSAPSGPARLRDATPPPRAQTTPPLETGGAPPPEIMNPSEVQRTSRAASTPELERQAAPDPTTPLASALDESVVEPKPKLPRRLTNPAGVGTVGLRASSPGLGGTGSPPGSGTGTHPAGQSSGGLLDVMRQPPALRPLSAPRAAFDRRRNRSPSVGGTLPEGATGAVAVPVPRRVRVNSIPANITNPFSSSPVPVQSPVVASGAQSACHVTYTAAQKSLDKDTPADIPEFVAPRPMSTRLLTLSAPAFSPSPAQAVVVNSGSPIPPHVVPPFGRSKRSKRKSSNPVSTPGSHGTRSLSGHSTASVARSVVSLSAKAPRAAAQLALASASSPISSRVEASGADGLGLTGTSFAGPGLATPQEGQELEPHWPVEGNSAPSDEGAIERRSITSLASAQGGLAFKRPTPAAPARQSSTASESLRRLMP